MNAPKHIPGIRRQDKPEPARVRKGIGVLGLHEGRTLLVGLDRCAHAHAVAGCDLDPDKIEACRRERPGLFYTADCAAMLARPDVDIVAIFTPDPLYALRHHDFNSEVHGMHYGEFANYAEAFARSLIEGGPCAPDLEEGLATFAVMEAVRRSAMDGGRPVAVAPLLEEIGLPRA